MTLEDRTNYRMAVVEVVSQCTDIVYDLLCDAGTGVVMEGSVLQRALRDTLTLRSHFMIMPDLARNVEFQDLDWFPDVRKLGDEKVQAGVKKTLHPFLGESQETVRTGERKKKSCVRLFARHVGD